MSEPSKAAGQCPLHDYADPAPMPVGSTLTCSCVRRGEPSKAAMELAGRIRQLFIDEEWDPTTRGIAREIDAAFAPFLKALGTLPLPQEARVERARWLPTEAEHG